MHNATSQPGCHTTNACSGGLASCAIQERSVGDEEILLRRRDNLDVVEISGHVMLPLPQRSNLYWICLELLTRHAMLYVYSLRHSDVIGI